MECSLVLSYKRIRKQKKVEESAYFPIQKIKTPGFRAFQRF
jgi:hypothetical protein